MFSMQTSHGSTGTRRAVASENPEDLLEWAKREPGSPLNCRPASPNLPRRLHPSWDKFWGVNCRFGLTKPHRVPAKADTYLGGRSVCTLAAKASFGRRHCITCWNLLAELPDPMHMRNMLVSC